MVNELQQYINLFLIFVSIITQETLGSKIIKLDVPPMKHINLSFKTIFSSLQEFFVLGFFAEGLFGLFSAVSDDISSAAAELSADSIAQPP
jgi:hypothetical protein